MILYKQNNTHYLLITITIAATALPVPCWCFVSYTRVSHSMNGINESRYWFDAAAGSLCSTSFLSTPLFEDIVPLASPCAHIATQSCRDGCSLIVLVLIHEVACC